MSITTGLVQMRVGYIRVSSDKQDSKRQRTELEPLKLEKFYVDDVGRNSRDLPEKRKAFQQLLADVRLGQITEIYVDRQDRFGARDSYQFGSFVDTLRSNGCALFDSTGKCLSADDDTAILTNAIGSIASRREQQEKAHRNITGKIPAVRAGLYQGGYPPYGLDVVCFRAGVEIWRVIYIGKFDRWKVYPDGSRERFTGKGNFPASDPSDELRVRPNADRVETVRNIFEWYTTEAISCGAIGKRLAKLGVDPVFGGWDKQKIAKLLENPAYIAIPTWNKRAASRFSEFKDGKVQSVTEKRSGRVRQTSDYIQPEQRQFEPIVSPELFEKTQKRIAEGRKGKFKAANTASLWLRPFLRCGKCGQPMHASNNTGRSRIIPSYFCSTYNRYGKDACNCHRVRHSVLEPIVIDYLKQCGVKIDSLLKSPIESAVDLTGYSEQYFDVCCDMMSFEAIHGETGSYGDIYSKVLPKLQKQLAKKEAELTKLIESYATLPDSVRHRINGKLELLQAEIEDLQKQAVDLRVPRASAYNALQARRREVASAIDAVQSCVEHRKLTEAVRPIIDHIMLRHKYSAGGKSILESVEIVAASGEVIKVTSPGRGLLPRDRKAA